MSISRRKKAKVTTVSPVKDKEEVSEFSMAKETVKHTLKTITYSTNKNKKKNEEKEKVFQEMRKESDMIDKVSAPIFSLQWVKIMADLSLMYQVGNCNEKSCVSMCYIMTRFSELPLQFRPSVYLFNNPFSDHFFVVTGLPSGFEEYNQRTWIGATVCDSWANESYTITKENFSTLAGNKAAMLSKEAKLCIDVISIADFESSMDTTVPIVGIFSQAKIVLRLSAHWDNDSKSYVGKSHNLNVPITYDPGIDWAGNKKDSFKENLRTNKQKVASTLQRFFKEGSRSKKERQEIVDITIDYLYPSENRK